MRAGLPSNKQAGTFLDVRFLRWIHHQTLVYLARGVVSIITLLIFGLELYNLRVGTNLGPITFYCLINSESLPAPSGLFVQSLQPHRYYVAGMIMEARFTAPVPLFANPRGSPPVRACNLADSFTHTDACSLYFWLPISASKIITYIADGKYLLHDENRTVIPPTSLQHPTPNDSNPAVSPCGILSTVDPSLTLSSA